MCAFTQNRNTFLFNNQINGITLVRSTTVTDLGVLYGSKFINNDTNNSLLTI